MFKVIRRQLNPANAMAFVALVFATTGGAFAVTGHGASPGSPATASKSKVRAKVRPGPRGPAGPRGATGASGPAGPVGSAGAKGDTGARGETGANGQAGASGTNGKDGESVVSVALAPGEDGCIEGGTKFTVGGNVTTACNGEKGEGGSGGGGGFPKTLPAGETETGSFVATFEHAAPAPPGSALNVAISFPVKLPIALPFGSEYYVTTEQQQNHTASAACAGSAEEPTAETGTLCVYEGYHSEVEEEQTITTLTITADLAPGSAEAMLGTSTTGALLHAKYQGTQEDVVLGGTWAVSAP